MNLGLDSIPIMTMIQEVKKNRSIEEQIGLGRCAHLVFIFSGSCGV